MSYVEKEFMQSVNARSMHRSDSWMWSDQSQTTSDLCLRESSAHRNRHDSPWRFEFTQRHNGSWNNLFVFAWWSSSVCERRSTERRIKKTRVIAFWDLMCISSPPVVFSHTYTLFLQPYFFFCCSVVCVLPVPPSHRSSLLLPRQMEAFSEQMQERCYPCVPCAVKEELRLRNLS